MIRHWQTSLAGVALIFGGIYDFLAHAETLDNHLGLAICLFIAGIGLSLAKDHDK